MKYVCEKCGSENIQVPMWVNPNTEETDGFYKLRECYCDKCGKYGKWMLKAEKKP